MDKTNFGLTSITPCYEIAKNQKSAKKIRAGTMSRLSYFDGLFGRSNSTVDDVELIKEVEGDYIEACCKVFCAFNDKAILVRAEAEIIQRHSLTVVRHAVKLCIIGCQLADVEVGAQSKGIPFCAGREAKGRTGDNGINLTAFCEDLNVVHIHIFNLQLADRQIRANGMDHHIICQLVYLTADGNNTVIITGDDAGGVVALEVGESALAVDRVGAAHVQRTVGRDKRLNLAIREVVGFVCGHDVTIDILEADHTVNLRIACALIDAAQRAIRDVEETKHFNATRTVGEDCGQGCAVVDGNGRGVATGLGDDAGLRS